MDLISEFLSSSIGLILKSAGKSKVVNTAKEELLEGFWAWVRPLFIKDVPDLEASFDSPETEIKVQEKLLELIKDENFFHELVKQVDLLQKAGIREKNIVKRNITKVKKIRIGDKTYSGQDTFDKKNIVEGNINDADEFILGDGH